MKLLILACGFIGHRLRVGAPLLYTEKFGIECKRCGGRWTVYGHDHEHEHLGTDPTPRPATSIPLREVARTIVAWLVEWRRIDSTTAQTLNEKVANDPWSVIEQYAFRF